ncbi:MAG: hypothetical protein QG671_4018 [Actinomycetota bacterium]|nr:hypothetical protein [Actinomycetota bacterium]
MIPAWAARGPVKLVASCSAALRVRCWDPVGVEPQRGCTRRCDRAGLRRRCRPRTDGTMTPVPAPTRIPRPAASTPVTLLSRCRARTQVRPMITSLGRLQNSFGYGPKRSCSQAPSSMQVTGYDFGEPPSRPTRPGSIAAWSPVAVGQAGGEGLPGLPGRTPLRLGHHRPIHPRDLRLPGLPGRAPLRQHSPGAAGPVPRCVFPAYPAGLHCGPRRFLAALAIRYRPSRPTRPGSIAAAWAGRTTGRPASVFPAYPAGLHCGWNGTNTPPRLYEVFPAHQAGLHRGRRSLIRTVSQSPFRGSSSSRARKGMGYAVR